MAEFSVKDLIEKYYLKNHELLKYALIAKAEEDKKETAREILFIEQARIYLKHLDIELDKHTAPVKTPIISPSRKPLSNGIHKPKKLHKSSRYLLSPQSSTSTILPPIRIPSNKCLDD